MMYLVATLLFGHLCLLQGAFLNQDGMQAANWKKHARVLDSNIEKREFTQEQFDARMDESQAQISVLTSMITALTNDLSTNIGSLNAATNSMTGRISTLETNYNSNTVKKCISGKIEDAKVGTHTIYFSPQFSSTPSFVYAFSAFDDGGKNVRFNTKVQSISSSNASVKVETWSSSNIYWAEIRYIACA